MSLPRQSPRSGMSPRFDLSGVPGLQHTVKAIGEDVPTDKQADCFASEYPEAGPPRFFAIGSAAGSDGALAWQNVGTCGIELSEGED